MHVCSDWTLTPGAGTTEPIRKITTMKSTNKIFRRRSGVLNALAKAPNTLSSHKFPVPGQGRGLAKQLGKRRTRARPNSSVRITYAGSHEPWHSHLGGGSPGRRDLLLGGLRELVNRNLQCNGQLAVAQHLHRETVADRTLGDQVGNADLATF